MLLSSWMRSAGVLGEVEVGELVELVCSFLASEGSAIVWREYWRGLRRNWCLGEVLGRWAQFWGACELVKEPQPRGQGSVLVRAWRAAHVELRLHLSPFTFHLFPTFIHLCQTLQDLRTNKLNYCILQYTANFISRPQNLPATLLLAFPCKTRHIHLSHQGESDRDYQNNTWEGTHSPCRGHLKALAVPGREV